MNVDLGIWDKLARGIFALMFIAAVTGVILWYRPVVRENEQWRKLNLELEGQIRRQIQIEEELKASIKAMQDPANVEREARERLGLARPGETVVRFEAPSTNRAGARP